MGKYDDIIERKYEGSTTKGKMSMKNRAAQFAPFAALTGHGEAIRETERLTSERVELSSEEQKALSQKLKMVLDHIESNPILTFTVFRPDKLKSGGSYLKVSGSIRKYDDFNGTIIMADRQILKITSIVDIDGELFKEMLF